MGVEPVCSQVFRCVQVTQKSVIHGGRTFWEISFVPADLRDLDVARLCIVAHTENEACVFRTGENYRLDLTPVPQEKSIRQSIPLATRREVARRRAA